MKLQIHQKSVGEVVISATSLGVNLFKLILDPEFLFSLCVREEGKLRWVFFRKKKGKGRRMCLAGSWMRAWNVRAHLEQLQVRISMVQVEVTTLRIPTFSAAQRIPGCHLPSPASPVEIPISGLSHLPRMSRGTISFLRKVRMVYPRA